MTEIDEVIARGKAQTARIEALLREILARFNVRLPDVPLHQRGFGVMDEPPA